MVGRPEEAPELVQEAIDLSPHDPYMGMFYWIKGRAYFSMENYDDAIVWLRKSVEIQNNVWYNRAYLTAAYALTDRNQEPEDSEEPEESATLDEFVTAFPEYTLDSIRDLYATKLLHDDPVMQASIAALYRGLQIAASEGSPAPISPPAEEAANAEYIVWYGTNRRPVDPRDPSRGYSRRRAAPGVVHYGSSVHPEITQDRLSRLVMVDAVMDADGRPATPARGRRNAAGGVLDGPRVQACRGKCGRTPCGDLCPRLQRLVSGGGVARGADRVRSVHPGSDGVLQLAVARRGQRLYGGRGDDRGEPGGDHRFYDRFRRTQRR